MPSDLEIAATPTPTPPAGESTRLQTALLVVDDRPDRRLAMQAALEDLEHPVVLAESGTDALRHLLKEDFSVILLDINMPDMDGIELATIIRSRRRTAQTPIIFYTSDADTARKRQPQAYKLGAVDVLAGPVSGEVLRSKVAVFADFHRRLGDVRRQAGERERMLRAEAAQAEAERASAAKDHFLAMLSHELRTPLSPVINTIELLLGTQDHPPELRDQLETIRRNVVLEARLIDDLLDLTKVSRGKVTLRLEPIDVHDTIQQVLHICRKEMEEKHITAHVSTPDTTQWVRADSARLKQILWNLIHNAVKYSGQHGSIFISTARSGRGHVCIQVRDEGCGISAEFLPNIFEAFRQGIHTNGGLGLGLAITHSLVALHEGTIDVKSAGPGKGATFTVSLPAASAPALSSPPVASPAGTPASPGVQNPSQRRTGTILLVEDHPDSRRTLERLLSRKGYVVETAQSVASALEMTHLQRFDMIISDIGLPDGTGCDFLSQVPEEVRPQAFALSGFGMDEDIRRSLAAGFSHHLTKPVNATELDAIMQRLLSVDGRTLHGAT